MKITSKLRTPVSCTMIACMLFIGMPIPGMADVVGTQELTMQVALQVQRDEVRDFVARDDVRDALLGYGVNPADVDSRIDNMTSTELLQMQNQLADMPAGGSVAGAVLGIILIFVLLDLLGATDVFPRI